MDRSVASRVDGADAGRRLAPVLARWRRELGWTQDELAARAGISRGYISRLERGLPGRPGLDVLSRLCAAMGRGWPSLFAAAGLSLALVPRFVTVTLFEQPSFPDAAWLRLLGIHAVGLAMLMVLVAHRTPELWWWSWAFALVDVGTTAVVILNPAFRPGPSVLWWLFGLAGLGFTLAMLFALWVTAQENPVP